MQCLQCKQDTTNPKFCSMSCAAKYNNKTNPKRQPQGRCKNCNKPIRASYKYCPKHGPVRNGLLDKQTIAEAMLFRPNVHRSSIYVKIRMRAKYHMSKTNIPKVCAKCGYSKHVEVSHKIGIAEFDPNTQISVVNSLNNLVYLCPNCHWEFDNKLITI